MATTTLKTRIQLRRDTTANWILNKDVVPGAGEPCFDVDTGVLKIGDGATTYENLEAVGASTFSHYEGITGEGEDDNAVIARVTADHTLVKGDICIVKTLISGDKYSYKSFVYDGEHWGAMDGNYSAENVYFTSDLTYTAPIGVLTVPSSGSGSIASTGKNVNDVLASILAKETNPTITQPSASVTLTGAGAKEVGSKFTPAYTASLNPGKYQFGPDTGITATTYAISDSNSKTADTATGTFDEMTVGDDTNYKVSATISYGDGAIPKTNIKNDYAAGQIKAGSKTASSAAVTGFRNWFMYVGTDETELSSAVIRSATAKGTGKNASTQNGVTIPAGTKRIFVAIPAGTGYTKQLKSVIDVDGMGLDVFANFTLSTVAVEGANGYTAMNYNVWCAENANGFSATHYNLVIG